MKKRLGITLFVRANREIVLTEAGESLFKDAKYLAAYSARAVDKAKEIENRKNRQTIRIGTSIMTPAKFLSDMWEAVKNNVPIVAIDDWVNIHPLLKIIPVEWNYKTPFGVMYSPAPTEMVEKFITILKEIIK